MELLSSTTSSGFVNTQGIAKLRYKAVSPQLFIISSHPCQKVLS